MTARPDVPDTPDRTDATLATIDEVRALPVVATINVPLWDGDARDDELHAPRQTISVPVVIKPDLPILGHLLREHGYSTTETYIVLREWNEQVLLHEILHVILGAGPAGDPDNHRAINAIEVGLSPFFTVPRQHSPFGESHNPKPVDPMTTPDRTDAIARWFAVHVIDCHISWQDGGWYCGAHDEYTPNDDYCGTVDELAERFLATDDPAAVAALAATLAERHPDALLTALTNAGQLEQDHKDVCGHCGVDYGDMHPRDCEWARGSRPSWVEHRRLVTPWREV